MVSFKRIGVKLADSSFVRRRSMVRARPQLISAKLEKLHLTPVTVGLQEVARKRNARCLSGWTGPIDA